jgi:hypothetical protein
LRITFGTVTFDDYLTSKKIDGSAFRKAEPELFQTWNTEFDQMHANSFTVQKLNLINPIRKKYQLKEKPADVKNADPSAPSVAPANPAAPRVARPVIKPKIN